MAKQRTRAAIYARISDARDGDTAGVDRQVQDCLAHCQALGYEVLEQFIDNNRSAYRPGGKRPAYDRLMAAVLRDDVDVIVVQSAERLYRRLTDLETLAERLKAHRVRVQALKSGNVDLSTADGQMHAGMLAVVAKHESAKRGERVARAARQRAEQGRFGGGTRRFGYDATCTALMPEEADAIRYAYQAVAAGGSVRSVWREWQARGLKGPSGGQLPSSQVTVILRRPMNAGLNSFGGELLPGQSSAPAIIDVATWTKVQAILADPTRATSRRGRPSKALMAGYMVCGECGHKVYRHYRSRSRANRAAYACTPGKCTTRSGDMVDTFITELLGKWLARNASRISRPTPSRKRSKTDPAAQANELRAKLDDLALLLAAGDLTARDYARATKEISARLDVLEAQVASESGMAAVQQLAKSPDVERAWIELDTDGKRAIIGELLASGVIERIVLRKVGPNHVREVGIDVLWKRP